MIIETSGRPVSRRGATVPNARPARPCQRRQEDRGAQAKRQHMQSGGDQQRAEHDPLADREVDHPRTFVDEDERQRDQGVNRAREQPFTSSEMKNNIGN